MPRYFLLDKPYDVLSQFTREAPHHRTLADVYDFPPRVYPVGRLDRDSEGLLLLTDDASLNQRVLHPEAGHGKTYRAQVEGIPTTADLRALAAGVTIRIRKRDYHCTPLEAGFLPAASVAAIPPRTPPVRHRERIPTTWLSLTLTEGKNRQVRRMCAAVGFPVLRLRRFAIGGITLDDLGGQTVREVGREWLLTRLR